MRRKVLPSNSFVTTTGAKLVEARYFANGPAHHGAHRLKFLKFVHSSIAMSLHVLMPCRCEGGPTEVRVILR